MTKVLTAGEILSSVDAQYSEVDCPEWGGIVRLRGLSAEEALEFTAASKKTERDSAALLVVMSVVGEDGRPIFQQTDIPELRRKSMKVLMRLQRAALKLNGLDAATEEAEAAKND